MEINRITEQDKKDYENAFLTLKIKNHETIFTKEETVELIRLLQNELNNREPVIEFCSHTFENENRNGTIYRICNKCGIEPHKDGRYDYLCGREYCRCMN